MDVYQKLYVITCCPRTPFCGGRGKGTSSVSGPVDSLPPHLVLPSADLFCISHFLCPILAQNQG